MELVFTDEYANLFLLANGIILLLYLAIKKKKRQRAMKFGNYETLQKVAGKNFLKSSNIILFTRMLALTVLIVGISSPVIVDEVRSADTDYVLAIDSSSGMLVSDVEPNRFDAAKDVSQRFVEETSDSTRIGVTSFAGDVTNEQQLTTDKEEIFESIQNVEIGEEAGTAMGDAIYSSSSMLLDTNESRTVILVTKGGNTVGIDLNESVEFAQRHDVTIHTVGIGEELEEEREEFGMVDGVNASRAEYPDLDTGELLMISEATGGEFLTVSDAESMEEAFISLEKSEVRTDISRYFIFLAVILIILEWVLGTTRYSILP